MYHLDFFVSMTSWTDIPSFVVKEYNLRNSMDNTLFDQQSS
jgi:hypothetical protein